MTCYVTSYYDIGRQNWDTIFSRTFDKYLDGFKPFIKLFDKNICDDDEMIVFIDEKYFNFLLNIIPENTNIRLISLTKELINKFPIWQTLETERSIMADEKFKLLTSHRTNCPETIYPEYTLINHCKIDFISFIIDLNVSDKIYYIWVDFGLLGQPEIPEKLVNIHKLSLDKINYNLINPIEDTYKDPIFNIIVAPEVIGGGVFLGRKDKIKEYQFLYHQMLHYFQHSLNIADDDQHIALQCYFYRPELFKLHDNYGWYKFLVNFQK